MISAAGVPAAGVPAGGGDSVMLLTREAAGPGLVLVDVESGALRPLGWHPAVYHAALHVPAAGGSVIEVENLQPEGGWQLHLVTGADSTLLSDEWDDEVLPAPSPDGGAVAFLTRDW